MKERKFPQHIALIMDGNGRWAKRRFRPRGYGHKAGVENMFRVCGHAFEMGIQVVTVYALSTENLSRPKEEVDELFNLFRTFFGEKRSKMQELLVKINVMGDISALPEDIQQDIAQMMRETETNTHGQLNICINYGARQEIVRAVNCAVSNGKPVDMQSFSALLYSGGLPDPDLIIRTGGELRLSNFLMYQAAYSELYFSKKMWPDFSERDLEHAIGDYMSRDRRFGKV